MGLYRSGSHEETIGAQRVKITSIASGTVNLRLHNCCTALSMTIGSP